MADDVTIRRRKLTEYRPDPQNANLGTERGIAHKRTYVYALCDPDTGDVRYIGKTVDVRRRLYRHRHENDGSYRARWLAKLTSAGQSPVFKLLEVVEVGENWAAVERRWIRDGRAAGWPLTNTTNGGDGMDGYKWTAEDRRKLSAALKGRTLTPEWKRKVGEASKGRIDGVKNPKASLTPSLVRAIRQEYADQRLSYSAISEKYGVTKAQVGKIVRGEVWQSAGGPIQAARPAKKLSDDQVQEIRRLAQLRIIPQSAISKRFGISQSLVNMIATGKRWGNLMDTRAA